MWSARARKAPDGTIEQIPQNEFVWSAAPVLRPDRRYSLVAVYDNPTSETLILGGMATLGGVVVPTDGWPEVDREHPHYRAHYADEMRSGPVGAGGGG